jgi:hypothetical protein
MKLMRKAILVMGLTASAAAAAADIDGTVPLTCTPSAGFDCTPEKSCGKLKPQSDPPPGGWKVDIDFANKVIKTPYHQTNLLPVQNTSINDDQLILQGASDKFAWSSVVLRKTGKITITVADLKGAYLIFGQCKAATPGG